MVEPRSSMSGFVPALRFHALTPCYDTIVALTTRETVYRQQLLTGIEAVRPSRLLDLGCGTGSLAIMAATRHPDWTVIGVDADPAILSIAARKADRAGATVEFVNACAQEPGLVNASVDVVVSSLLFHHLDGAGKHAAFAQCLRLLRPGGEMHLLDWGKPQDVLMSVAILPVRMLDGFANTRDNVRGALAGMMTAAGFSDVRTVSRLRTPLGSLALIKGVRPATAGEPGRTGGEKS